MDEEKLIKAGKIHTEVKTYAKSIIKKGIPLLEIAEKIETKIKERGGLCAFPVNLGINETTAHYTPSYNDEATAHGLIKVDFGVHIDGWAVDGAFSIDLEESEENKKIIKTAEVALKEAIQIIKKDIPIREIGKKIQEVTEKNNLAPIINLGGHSLEQYDLHAGIAIPNKDDHNEEPLEEGIYAIEPFVSNKRGFVHDGKPSEIYMFTHDHPPRSPLAREVLALIKEQYKTLPFTSRWIVQSTGVKGILGLRELERNGNLHRFNELVEEKGAKVAQAEYTILVKNKDVIVLNP